MSKSTLKIAKMARMDDLFWSRASRPQASLTRVLTCANFKSRNEWENVSETVQRNCQSKLKVVAYNGKSRGPHCQHCPSRSCPIATQTCHLAPYWTWSGQRPSSPIAHKWEQAEQCPTFGKQLWVVEGRNLCSCPSPFTRYWFKQNKSIRIEWKQGTDTLHLATLTGARTKQIQLVKLRGNGKQSSAIQFDLFVPYL